MGKTYKNPSIVSGMSVQDILDMDAETFNKLNTSDLRKVVGRLVSAGNKRLRNFEKNNMSSPATRELARSGGQLSTKNKDLDALRSEFTRAKNFLNAKSSSVAGWRKVRDDTMNTLKQRGVDIQKKADENLQQQAVDYLGKHGKIYKDGKELTGAELLKEYKKAIGSREYKKQLEGFLNDTFDQIWRTYEKLKESDPYVSIRQVKYKVLGEIADTVTEKDAEEAILEMQERLDEIYEEEQELQQSFDISDLFDFGQEV